eukprot:CAMPEP_0206368524 /NCGR_PEP_ID=MMETSP0294-20121207/4720_1 /ASSEMBLY_ACC=CAM_ASM_000327 /TAXON_ID=39354 /ORGANISM="Heterosigma akashiwo, Strain CCMP2393" /LENGTH=125 /DNA_ID=CAMNT_0053815039 /DNA_START=196 /DNA_END=570 /DNA_ORIENTATION=+
MEPTPPSSKPSTGRLTPAFSRHRALSPPKEASFGLNSPQTILDPGKLLKILNVEGQITANFWTILKTCRALDSGNQGTISPSKFLEVLDRNGIHPRGIAVQNFTSAMNGKDLDYKVFLAPCWPKS